MLDAQIRSSIQTYYTDFLKSKSLKPRYGQKLMIAAIAQTLANIRPNTDKVCDEPICVIEAGTGTGKTIAYLLAALPLAKSLNKTVVVSTATIALQEQIIYKDIPDLIHHSGLEATFSLAKGRGRYLCLQRLEKLLSQSPEADLIPSIDEHAILMTESDKGLYSMMMQSLTQGQWDGDRDSWDGELEPDAWQRVTTDHRRCSGRRCSHVRQCAFFKAREHMEDVDCIVANHDLVMADLALGGGAILSKPEDTIYIFDEAHHLPEKSLNHFASHTRVVSTIRWLGMTEGQWSNFFEPLLACPVLRQLSQPIETSLKKNRRLMEELQTHLAPLIEAIDRDDNVSRFRFPKGQVPDEIVKASALLEIEFLNLVNGFEKMSQQLGHLLEDEHTPIALVDLEDSFAAVGAMLSRSEGNAALWQSFANTQVNPDWPIARWITFIEQTDYLEFELFSSPVLASNMLDQHLWQKCAGAVLTSATLTALGQFDRFTLRAGTPENARYEVVPSPFDYANAGTFSVPSQSIEANQAEAHTQNIIDLLPEIIDLDEATLVLFSSKKQMREVYEGLPLTLAEIIKRQGDDSKQALIKQHKSVVDSKKGSILFGLASFAEGLDLPGDYCKHVIIAKLPFSVPDDPVEAALAEWVQDRGGNAFMELAVPDAAIKLVQASGRLLRSESDSGRITLLDKRIVTKRYGRAILDSLPPFKRVL